MTASELLDRDCAELRQAAATLEEVAYRLAGRADAKIISQLIGMSAEAMMIEGMLRPRGQVN